MIGEEIRNIKSGKKELRQFGYTMSIVLGVLGVLFLWRGKEWYPYFIVLSVVFLVPAIILPILLKPLQKLWMILAVLLGWFMTRIILSILFYLVITPIGFILRLCGKDFLNRSFEKYNESYWIPRETGEVDLFDTSADRRESGEAKGDVGLLQFKSCLGSQISYRLH